MSCNEAKLLLHALIDRELDAAHAQAVEAHVSGCARCAAEVQAVRDMRRTMSEKNLGYAAPAGLRARIEASVPVQPAMIAKPSRRSLLAGFAAGAAMSAAAAAGIALVMVRTEEDQRLLRDVVSAHLRSLQPHRLTDVASSDQHTVKPWFNGRLDLSPPVPDLAAAGFTLVGGRLDYILGNAVAAIAYRRRAHVINLFVLQGEEKEDAPPRSEMVQGFNIRRWTSNGLSFIAISDINGGELNEFVSKFQPANSAGA